MKNISILSSAVITGRISIRRSAIFFAVCIFIPVCLSHAGNYGNYLVNTEVLLHSDNMKTDEANHQIHEFATNAGGDLPEHNSTRPLDKNNKTNNNNSEKNTSDPVNNTKPLHTTETEHHMDPHDANEEEKWMTINLPAIMRLAIIVLFVIVAI